MPNIPLTFTPLAGARTYYIRQCLHNWTTASCTSILTRLRDAMSISAPTSSTVDDGYSHGSYSRLLIHELVVPETAIPGDGTWAATQDVNMMAMAATMERTEAEWRALVEGVGGLKVVKVWSGRWSGEEAVVECVRV